MHIIESTSLKKTIKSLVNLLIPVSCLLSFSIIWLLEKVIRVKLYSSSPELALSSIARNLVLSGSLRIIALSGIILSTIIFFVWFILLIKSRSEKHLLETNKAVIIVLAIWVLGTLLLPSMFYLVYKPIFDPIIK